MMSDDETDNISNSQGSAVSAGSASSAGTTSSDMDMDIYTDEDFTARATPFADVLNSLHVSGPQDGVPSMSHWSDVVFNDARIRSRFKIFRKLVTPDELSAHHFWEGEVDLVLINSKLQALHDYAVESTAYFDANEKDLFCPSNISNSLLQTTKLADEIFGCSSGYFTNRPNRLKLRNLDKLGGGTASEVEDMIASQLRGRLHKWIIDVHRVITKHPRECSEKAYQELARSFFDAFGLGCRNGDSESFAIQYDDNGEEKEVMSYPDLLLCQLKPEAPYCAVVEVKSMVIDPDFKHLSPKPKKANLKTFNYDSSEKPSSPKKEKTSEDPSRKRKRAVSFENSTEEPGRTTDCEQPQSTMIDDICLSSEIRSLIRPFFCQLFGSIMALDQHQSLFPKKVMGIGVVGFKMVFMSFQQHDGINFSKVCETPGSRIDVFMTRPLSMLSLSDRAEIAKILLQLATQKIR